MKYKVSETVLGFREYGRNILGMVEFLKTIEDPARRNFFAKEVIRIMSNTNPDLKDQPDYRQKLWDHLFMIADFDLDVETPYGRPVREEVIWEKPQKLPYQKDNLKYKQYGRNIALMIRKASEFEDKEKQIAYLNVIANIMRQFLRLIDKDTPVEDIIADQINEISGGKLKVDPNDLVINKPTFSYSNSPRNNGYATSKKKNYRGKKHRRRNN